MEYSKMLDRLYMSLPKGALGKERFEIPGLESHIQGNRTVVRNFSQALKTVRREERDFIKFVTKETATSAISERGMLTLNSKFSPKQINDLFGSFVKNFVLCRECKRPDTKIVEQHGVKVLKCEACGAASPVGKL